MFFLGFLGSSMICHRSHPPCPPLLSQKNKPPPPPPPLLCAPTLGCPQLIFFFFSFSYSHPPPRLFAYPSKTPPHNNICTVSFSPSFEVIPVGFPDSCLFLLVLVGFLLSFLAHLDFLIMPASQQLSPFFTGPPH